MRTEENRFDSAALRKMMRRCGITGQRMSEELEIQPETFSHKLRGDNQFLQGEIYAAARLLGLDAQGITRCFFTRKV